MVCVHCLNSLIIIHSQAISLSLILVILFIAFHSLLDQRATSCLANIKAFSDYLISLIYSKLSKQQPEVAMFNS